MIMHVIEFSYLYVIVVLHLIITKKRTPKVGQKGRNTCSLYVRWSYVTKILKIRSLCLKFSNTNLGLNNRKNAQFCLDYY